MKTIKLHFGGYWLEKNKDDIPDESGVYCVYSCTYNKEEDTVCLKKLLYIGESENANERIANHDRLVDWMKSLPTGQTLCYSFAPTDSEDRERAEAALIFEVQPPFNTEHTKEFIYNDTEIKTSGKNKFLPVSFSVEKGDKK